ERPPATQPAARNDDMESCVAEQLERRLARFRVKVIVERVHPQHDIAPARLRRGRSAIRVASERRNPVHSSPPPEADGSKPRDLALRGHMKDTLEQRTQTR